MIQCKDCEFFKKGPDGEFAFDCDPFSTIKEPECLQKWTLIKINQLVASYQTTLNYYQKLAPMQEKMFKYMEQEIDEMSESEKWKLEHGEEYSDENDDSDEWGEGRRER